MSAPVIDNAGTKMWKKITNAHIYNIFRKNTCNIQYVLLQRTVVTKIVTGY